MRSLSILVPALNEERSITSVYTELTVGQPRGWEVQILVVDDGSTDRTATVAREAGAQVISHSSTRGLAQVFRTGVDAALAHGSEAIGVFDGDGQYRACDLWRLVTRVASGVDIAVGCRLWTRPTGMPRTRYALNRVGSRLLDAVGADLPDTQSGLRVFSSQIAREVRIRGNFTYTQEQIIRARVAGASLQYPPVEFLPRRYGNSRLVKSTPDYVCRVAPALTQAIVVDRVLGRNSTLARLNELGADFHRSPRRRTEDAPPDGAADWSPARGNPPAIRRLPSLG